MGMTISFVQNQAVRNSCGSFQRRASLGIDHRFFSALTFLKFMKRKYRFESLN
jgi:hypothetical protein